MSARINFRQRVQATWLRSAWWQLILVGNFRTAVLTVMVSITMTSADVISKNVNGRAAAKNDDSHCEPM